MEVKLVEKVYGFGVYDSEEPRSVCTKGKITYNQIYYRWRAMIQRCYDPSVKTFGLAAVCNEWASYSNFKVWMEAQIWDGLYLDKDLLSGNEKVYSPSTCAFVPSYINALLNTRNGDRGRFPLGVSYRPKCPTMINEFKKCYSTYISIDGRQRIVSSSETVEEAHKVWQLSKANDIENKVNKFAKEPCFRSDVASILMTHIWQLRLNAVRGIETKGFTNHTNFGGSQ